MNKLIESQFDRLASNPKDLRLLKQLSLEFGSLACRCKDPNKVRNFRIIVANALKEIEKNDSSTHAASFVIGALSTILDACACIEEILTMESICEADIKSGKTMSDPKENGDPLPDV